MTTIRRTLCVCGALAGTMWNCGNNGQSTDMAPAAAPIVTSVSPVNSSTSGGGLLTVTGTGFLPGATVTIGGALCADPNITSTEITCTIPSGAAQGSVKCGPQLIQVQNPDMQTTTSRGFAYYSSAPTLAAAATFAVGTGPQDLVVGDFNRDSKLDLVTVNQNSDSISMLTGKGDGTFNVASNIPGTAKSGPWGIAAGDLDGDGRPDIVTVNNNGSVTVYMDNGAGQFGMPINTSLKGKKPQHLAIGSVLPGSKGDIITADGSSNTVSIFAGNGMGGFGTQTSLKASGGSGEAYVVLADVNGDSKPDLLVANKSTGNVSVFLANGTPTVFGTATNFTMGMGCNYLVVADFNKDGKLDIATSNGGAANVSVRLGDGAGGFGANANNYMAGQNPMGIAAADANGDYATSYIGRPAPGLSGRLRSAPDKVRVPRSAGLPHRSAAT